MARFWSWLYHETGLAPLWSSPRDTKFLCLQRFVRLFAFGATSLILALHLQLLGFQDELIGLFMSLTLFGDVLISFVLTLVADALGRKNILIIGALLMSISGIVFAFAENYWALLFAAIIGVISPSGTEIGPFRAIEESTLAQLSGKEHRADIFAWYALIGFAGSAFGSMCFGWIIDHLSGNGWSLVQAYRFTFLAYAGFGVVKLGLALCLSSATEQTNRKPTPATEPRPEQDANDPTQPLLQDSSNGSAESEAQGTEATQANGNSDQNGSEASIKTTPIWQRLIPHISPESRAILVKLSLLFAIDSFASGLVTVSWVAVFFHDKFTMASGALGTLFFTTGIIAAFSNLVAASLARRIGLLKSMVFTHLPSSIFLALIPVPSNKWLAMAFMALRASTMSMDTAPRQAFLAAAVLDSERTAVMGFVNVVRTMSQGAGPVTTGALRGAGKFWLVFVVAGSLKAAYDFGLLFMFLGFKARA